MASKLFKHHNKRKKKKKEKENGFKVQIYIVFVKNISMEGFRRQAGCDRSLESIKGCAAKNMFQVVIFLYPCTVCFGFFSKRCSRNSSTKRPMLCVVVGFFLNLLV